MALLFLLLAVGSGYISLASAPDSVTDWSKMPVGCYLAFAVCVVCLVCALIAYLAKGKEALDVPFLD